MSNHLGDTNKMVGDTPRMDASAHDDGAIWETGCDIERELNAANVEIEEKRKDVVWLATEKAELEERIKRLEDAGDYLCAAAAFMGWHDKIEAWNKAKEDNL